MVDVMDATNSQEPQTVRNAFAALKASEAEMLAAVTAARQAGSTWDSIGRVLGVTRQAAQKRFGTPPIPTTQKTPPHP